MLLPSVATVFQLSSWDLSVSHVAMWFNLVFLYLCFIFMLLYVSVCFLSCLVIQFVFVSVLVLCFILMYSSSLFLLLYYFLLCRNHRLCFCSCIMFHSVLIQFVFVSILKFQNLRNRCYIQGQHSTSFLFPENPWKTNFNKKCFSIVLPSV